jgi:acetyltransferase-like isoleucine patch superfamily enzyme
MKLNEILSQEPFRSDSELAELLTNMHRMREAMQKLTKEKFDRINPFVENLFDWKDKGKAIFGEEKNITIYDTCTIVGDVKVGENTWIGPYTALDGAGGLSIGKGCSISAGVNIVTHDSVKWALSGGKQAYEYAPIQIGDYCFIGTGAFISKGVTIGKHCLIGAGAVVTRNIPDYSIALGVPAVVKGRVVMNDGQVELVFDEK